MSVLFALILVLWVWGRPGIFGLRTGHARGSKMDFLVAGYFDVARCPLVGGKLDKWFGRGFWESGLHKSHYRPLAKTMINKGFFYKLVHSGIVVNNT